MISRDVIGILIIAVIYLCLLVVVFSPTIYAVWFYFMGRRVQIKSKSLLRIAILTGCINATAAYFIMHLAFDYFLASKVAEKEALAMQTMNNAIVSEQRFFASHGRYYSVGPVRGPYQNDLGLTVGKDVILQVVPQWDKAKAQETFQAYALHVWGKDLLLSTTEGKVEKAPADSEVSDMVRSKMLNSVK
ncbi:MAG: hypothetical protein ACLP5H_10705 [Desulfomonilaceae bacterium]